ncbi:hypothetical protein D7I43_24185, partial [Micromonospora globbae]
MLTAGRHVTRIRREACASDTGQVDRIELGSVSKSGAACRWSIDGEVSGRGFIDQEEPEYRRPRGHHSGDEAARPDRRAVGGAGVA